MITLNSSKQNFTLNVPTSIQEITPEYLKSITDHVTLEPNYALIALVLTTKLSEFCYTISNPKANNQEIGVKALIVKFNATEATNIERNKIAIISNSELERAYHLNVPCMITSDKVGMYLMSDQELFKSIQLGNAEDEKGEVLGNNYIKLLQFKIVPMCDIHGCIEPINEIKDEFIVEKK